MKSFALSVALAAAWVAGIAPGAAQMDFYPGNGPSRLLPPLRLEGWETRPRA